MTFPATRFKTDPQGHRINDQAVSLGVDACQQQSRADKGDDGHKRAKRKGDMVVRISDPVNRAGGREEKLVATQPVARGNQHEKDGAQNARCALTFPVSANRSPRSMAVT